MHFIVYSQKWFLLFYMYDYLPLHCVINWKDFYTDQHKYTQREPQTFLNVFHLKLSTSLSEHVRHSVWSVKLCRNHQTISLCQLQFTNTSIHNSTSTLTWLNWKSKQFNRTDWCTTPSAFWHHGSVCLHSSSRMYLNWSVSQSSIYVLYIQ